MAFSGRGTLNSSTNFFNPSGSSFASTPQKPLFAQQRAQKRPGAPSTRGPLQPSRLGQAVMYNDDEDETETSQQEVKPNRSGTFGLPFDDTYDLDDSSMFMSGAPGGELEMGDDDSGLMMLNTPAAMERVRKEAAGIFRASVAQSGPRIRDLRFAALAKDVYTHMGTASLIEPGEMILNTERLITRLYDEGVGEEEDEEKLDEALAHVAGELTDLWKRAINDFPQPDEEHTVEIGPGPNTSPLEKATYLANLALHVHHERYEDNTGRTRPTPLPETLFKWLDLYHNVYSGQTEEILRYRPSPASHALFWQAIFVALLRGKVDDAAKLLRQAGWDKVKKDNGENKYINRALESVQLATAETVAMLENCPGHNENWGIWNSDWTLWRVRTRGALDHLRRFAEGRDSTLGDSTFSDFTASVSSTRNRESMAGLARRAESQVPWEIYEKLNIIFDIVLGSKSAIINAAQDWCEATVGLTAWWDDRRADKFGNPLSMARSQALTLASQSASTDSYLDRLNNAFHAAVEQDFYLNSNNPVEVGIACIFEDNVKGLIGLLRGWSLPIASAVAEIASLGGWLPQHQPGAFFMEGLDQDDLDVLGVDPTAPDKVDGIKDSTLIQYAQKLTEDEDIGTIADMNGESRDGWELAIHVLGRMDSQERSEEMIGILVRHIVDSLHVDSNEVVDKTWSLLNELGMIPYAEEVVETYADILARDSHRYGEAMWYFALAHKPHKVREVMNLLISYSLIQSTAFPPNEQLDDWLHRLLNERNDTLEQCAKQDLEAAELLGKMLSGYASLRQYFIIRDDESILPNATPFARKQQAATALVSVIASSDDNIRGGLLDQTRDGIVSEDFLLALLGEAIAFVTNPDNTNVHLGQQALPILNLDQIDTILKAIEDLQAVSDRVRSTCEEFLQIVLASAPGGLKGSTPADMLKKNASGSLVLAGSTMVATQLKNSLRGGLVGSGAKMNPVKRGWDWRADMPSKTTGDDVMRRLRVGVAKDLAGLWLADADNALW
ncbi:hypothetical protein QBC45DRAFT_203918 [Copromyces sp. CBS 386.78]|nr:hypothetical protein QBC45DRAFT_203918 [Copromyces sp. CBS 386.78]